MKKMSRFNHGTLLCSLLEQKGITKAGLARELGVSRQLVNYWANSKTIRFDNVHAICKALKVNPEVFVHV